MDEARREEIELPWEENEEASFTKLLPLRGGVNARARFHRPDLWHAVHLGVGKAFIASCMAILQKSLPHSNIEERFREISSEYRSFCRDRRLQPFLTKVDKFTYNVLGPKEEPSAGWNKASLTSTMADFLEHLTGVYADRLEALGDERTKFMVAWILLWLT